ncbi:hypothetical protein B0H21DRAFT_144452 [Amylocystis lapponica]|nr:hypothetical protein B0H21DRAFT_144452 [Amylocystis lapponica]
MARNKNRIYMVLYHYSNDDRYHAALLVSKKPPGTERWRYHVINRLTPVRGGVRQDWVFDVVILGSRTTRMLALVLLGKTQRNCEDFSEPLASAPIVQDDVGWTCENWVFGAVQHLVNSGLMAPPAVAIETLYGVAAQLANEFKRLPPEERLRTPVPTCDSAGQLIESEIV